MGAEVKRSNAGVPGASKWKDYMGLEMGMAGMRVRW
jgi:hypothetical protein